MSREKPRLALLFWPYCSGVHLTENGIITCASFRSAPAGRGRTPGRRRLLPELVAVNPQQALAAVQMAQLAQQNREAVRLLVAKDILCAILSNLGEPPASTDGEMVENQHLAGVVVDFSVLTADLLLARLQRTGNVSNAVNPGSL